MPQGIETSRGLQRDSDRIPPQDPITVSVDVPLEGPLLRDSQSEPEAVRECSFCWAFQRLLACKSFPKANRFLPPAPASPQTPLKSQALIWILPAGAASLSCKMSCLESLSDAFFIVNSVACRVIPMITPGFGGSREPHILFQVPQSKQVHKVAH